MRSLIKSLIVVPMLSFAATSSSFAADPPKPTIVLVHGAFADSSSWNAVIERLAKDGFHVVAAANALRGVETDAVSVSALVRSVDGSVVLVGHSYGGSVITAAAAGLSNIKALVYVAAFIPDKGESALQLSGKFPGSTLGQALAPPVVWPDGMQDLYIDQAKFPAQFAADLPAKQARLMAATQRPIAQSALTEACQSASWQSFPVYSIYGSADLNIPPAAMEFMSSRAQSRRTLVINGASHVVMVSHPKEVAALIATAATNL